MLFQSLSLATAVSLAPVLSLSKYTTNTFTKKKRGQYLRTFKALHLKMKKQMKSEYSGGGERAKNVSVPSPLKKKFSSYSPLHFHSYPSLSVSCAKVLTRRLLSDVQLLRIA
jgi:hypothetical protein